MRLSTATRLACLVSAPTGNVRAMRERGLGAWTMPDALARGLVCLAMAALPLVMAPHSPDAFGVTKFTLVAVATILAAALAITARIEGLLPRLPLGSVWPFASFVAVLGAATIGSINPKLSLIGAPKRLSGFAGYVVYATLAVLVVVLYRSKLPALRRLILALILGGSLNAVYVIAQRFGVDPFEWRTASGVPFFRPFGAMSQSNFAGALHGMVLPLIAYAAMTTRGRLRFLFLVASMLNLIALWFTAARGGLLAAGAGAVVFVFVLRKRMPAAVLIAAGVALLGGLAFGGLILSRTGAPVSAPGSVRALRAEDTVARAETTRTRIFYWQAALDMAGDRPILGSGPDTYSMLYGRHRVPDDGREIGMNFTDKPHSVFLDHLVGAGTIGLVAYLMLLLFCLAKGYLAVRRLTGPLQILAGGVLASFVGYIAQSAVSIDEPPIATIGWLLMGSVVACASTVQMTAAQRPAASRKDIVAVALVIIVAAVLSTLALRPLRAYLQLGPALEHLNSVGETVELHETLDDAARLHPWDPGIHAEIAIFYVKESSGLPPAARREQLARAVAEMQEAWRLQPGKVQAAVNTARIYEALAKTGAEGYFEDSARWWAAAARSDPTDWAVHGERGLLLQSWFKATRDRSHLPDAARSLERALEISPRRPDLWRALAGTYDELGDERRAAHARKQAAELIPTDAERLADTDFLERRR